jgi:hypothetical protein
MSMPYGVLDMMLQLRLDERMREAAAERLADQAKQGRMRRQLRTRLAVSLYALAARVEGAPRLSAADA